MSFRFPTTSSERVKKNAMDETPPRARKKKKHLLRSPVALSRALSLVALPFAFSGVVGVCVEPVCGKAFVFLIFF